MRILALNLAAESRGAVEQALAGQGYTMTADRDLTTEAIQASAAEVVITEATPSDLSCCDIISQIRAVPALQLVKIVTIVHGGALERARALELRADDVISFPFDPVEFAARIRNQFRERQPEAERETRLQDALHREHLAESAVEALSARPASARRGWLLAALLVLSAAAVATALATVNASRHERRDTLQLRAEVARLNGGMLQQGELLRLVAQARDSAPTRALGPARQPDSSRQVLATTERRLSRLESEGRIAETIVHTYGPSVALLHVVVQFLDRDGHLVRVVLDSGGHAQIDDKGMVALTTDGATPPLALDVFGTGFLVAADGRLLTNHHVAEPWRGNPDLKPLFDRGATAFAASYTAYFPDATVGMPATLDKVAQNADLATLKLRSAAPPHATLVAIDERPSATVTGDAVVLIGYPTGIEGILARAGADVARQVAGQSHDVTEIMSSLAAQHLIRPTTTQGHIGDVLADKIVYDAATTPGGSGGPLFNRDGKVIGVNFAVLTGFGGSNLAIPVRYAEPLVK